MDCYRKSNMHTRCRAYGSVLERFTVVLLFTVFSFLCGLISAFYSARVQTCHALEATRASQMRAILEPSPAPPVSVPTNRRVPRPVRGLFS